MRESRIFSMILGKAGAFVLLFSFFSAVSMVRVYALGYGHPPISVAESRRLKTFVRAIKVEPNQFNWEGHSVTIDECWLDRDSDKFIVLFKLKIDGKVARERLVAKNEGKHLVFRRADRQNPPALAYNRSRGFTGQQRVHYLNLPSSLPKTMSLLVNTTTYANQRASTAENGVELQLFLSE